MNIDISNAHCGFRTLSVTHAWPRVARHSNLRVARAPAGRRPHPWGRWAGGRRRGARAWTRAAGARRAAARRAPGGGVSSRYANETPADRAGGAALAAPPTRPAGSKAPRRHVPSSRRAPRPRVAPRWRCGGRRRRPRRTIERCRRRSRAARASALGLLACPRPASSSARAGGAAAAAGESHARPRIR